MMIKVESCWAGGDGFYFRVTLPNAKADRFRVSDVEGRWTRRAAKESLNYLEKMGFKRQNIRFVHA